SSRAAHRSSCAANVCSTLGGAADSRAVTVAQAPHLPPVATLLRPGRKPWGCAAVLLPHTAEGDVDWLSFATVLERTVASGLTPAVNMDTGFVQLLDDATRRRVLATVADLVGDVCAQGR